MPSNTFHGIVHRCAAALAKLITVFWLLGTLWATSAHAQEKRYALLIGNQAYDTSVGVLKNPHNDIAMVAKALTAQGFEILPLVKDARRSAILGAVRGLADKLKVAGAGSVGFLYYSGHGAAEKDTGINYLIPVDAKDPGSAAFWDDSLKLDDVMKLLDQARSSVKFVVFDACRNELQLPTRDTTKGLVPVAEQQGFFIAYASAPGRTASDRGDGSGPYAAALATELAKQGLDHLNLFQNVKETVIATTGGSQHPWENNGLTKRVYLTGEPTTPADMALWESVRTSNDQSALKRYLERFPQGVFAATATQMIERLKAEDAQKEAAKQFDIERKAQEAKQAAELQKALEEVRKAQAALLAAEAKRASADKESAGAQKAPPNTDAQALRDAVEAADARSKLAEQRVAALEASRGSSAMPEGLSADEREQLRKLNEALAKKTATEAAAMLKAQQDLRSIKEYRIGGLHTVNNHCEFPGRPEIEVMTKPRFGTISFRDTVEPVMRSMKNPHCVGTKGPARVIIYTINDKDANKTDIDTIKVRIRYLPYPTRQFLTYQFDLERRISTVTENRVE